MALHGAAGYADVVLVAAGASRRMGGVDKVLAPLLGRPMLAWALDGIAAASAVRRLIVVVAPERVAELANLPWLRAAAVQVVAGGPRRQASVAAGLAQADAEVILVHDGARPLVAPTLVDEVAAAARAHGAAIPVRPIAETLKRIRDGAVHETLARADLATAQTPQGARLDVLLAALAATRAAEPSAPEFTDEAAMLEAHGVPVTAVTGQADNLKVTTRDDLRLAEALLAARLGGARTAMGRDSHPFGPGQGLMLGGIEIPEAPRLHGHSDGDAALHAIADALLGMAGLGDLGRRFPAGDPTTFGAASAALLQTVVADAAAAGWRATAVDLQIEGRRPQLGGTRLDAMRDAIADLLELSREAVSVRASTGNLDGPTGAGRSIAAVALVTAVPAQAHVP
jgi:2-C-methyl-D-erythritol 4-phosphate cytidylyltransferase / 2-C-methyl-D-erythritol 2,4-cyclodiphosphate synthase